MYPRILSRSPRSPHAARLPSREMERNRAWRSAIGSSLAGARARVSRPLLGSEPRSRGRARWRAGGGMMGVGFVRCAGCDREMPRAYAIPHRFLPPIPLDQDPERQPERDLRGDQGQSSDLQANPLEARSGSLLPHRQSARSKEPRCESQARQMGSIHSSGQSPGASFSTYNERFPAPR